MLQITGLIVPFYVLTGYAEELYEQKLINHSLYYCYFNCELYRMGIVIY